MTNKYQFILIPADDESMDAEYEMKTLDCQNTSFAIQKCEYGGGYAVNEYHYENNELVAMSDHGTFKTLKAAKQKAVTIYEKQTA